jgi:hypothetical protein
MEKNQKHSTIKSHQPSQKQKQIKENIKLTRIIMNDFLLNNKRLFKSDFITLSCV